MKFVVKAYTQPADKLNRDEMYDFASKNARICYFSGENPEDIWNEDSEKSKKRLDAIVNSGHHSPIEHNFITFHFIKAPILFALLLHNQRPHATSQRSGRYTENGYISEEENALFQKWKHTLYEIIEETYPLSENGKAILNDKGFRQTPLDKLNNNEKEWDIPFLSSKNKVKLADENARGFKSVMSPTTFTYTIDLRELNYQYHWAENLIDKKDCHPWIELLKPTLKDYCAGIESLDILKENLVDGKDRTFVFIEQNRKLIGGEHFGDTYATQYQGTTPLFGQRHRHRVSDFTISVPEEREDYNYYVPIILREYGDSGLIEDWLLDMQKPKVPQGTLLDITETGTLEGFKITIPERICTRAMLENQVIARNLTQKYVSALKSVDSPQAEILNEFLNRKHCKTCTEKCKFPEGQAGKRII